MGDHHARGRAERLGHEMQRVRSIGVVARRLQDVARKRVVARVGGERIAAESQSALPVASQEIRQHTIGDGFRLVRRMMVGLDKKTRRLSVFAQFQAADSNVGRDTKEEATGGSGANATQEPVELVERRARPTRFSHVAEIIDLSVESSFDTEAGGRGGVRILRGLQRHQTLEDGQSIKDRSKALTVLQPCTLGRRQDLLTLWQATRLERASTTWTFGNAPFHRAPAPDGHGHRVGSVMKLKRKLSRQLLKRHVIRRGGGDYILAQGRTKGAGPSNFFPDLLVGEALIRPLELALDAHLPPRITFAVAEKVDAILPLATATVGLDVWVVDQVSPQLNAGVLEDLLVARLGNLGCSECAHETLALMTHLHVAAVVAWRGSA
jgi:hypothetical protein